MNEILSTGFLQIALIGALLSALSSSLLSVFVTLKKVSYMGEAFAHISFAGIAFALLFSMNFNLVTVLFVSIIAFFIGFITVKYSIEHVNVTSIFLSVSMAIGVVLISINKNITIDIADYLFGDVLLVVKDDIVSLAVLLCCNCIFLILFFKELFYLSYNEEIAGIFKIPVKRVYFIFLILLAVNIVISVKIVGVILVTAQLILPGSAALNFSNNIKASIIISVIIALLSTVIGFYISYAMEIPSGASIVLVMFFFFLFSLLKRKRIK